MAGTTPGCPSPGATRFTAESACEISSEIVAGLTARPETNIAQIFL